MNKKIEHNNIIVEDLSAFDLEQTLECGQCFRYEALGKQEYVLVAFARILHIKQEHNRLIFYNTTGAEFEQIWRPYFDLDTNYEKIQQEIIANEKRILGKNTALVDAIREMNGIHILKQDFFEMLMTFILSQNKQIPHIKQIVELICTKYGHPVQTFHQKEYFSFPKKEVLLHVSENEFRLCKAGFRAPYLMNAVSAVCTGAITEESLRSMDDRQAIDTLMQIKGVGSKVASCVALFGLDKHTAFPIDVWVKRVMETLYFGTEVKNEAIKDLAGQLFGEYGGYAQQYLFYFGKKNGIAAMHGWAR